MENLTSNSFNAKILGKNRVFKFEIRNFIALKKRFGIEATDLVTKVLEGDLEAIIRMIWCGSLVFTDKFDISNPTEIKEEINIEDLYKMDYAELRPIGIEVVKGLLDSLPKTKKKKKTKATGILKKVREILKIK